MAILSIRYHALMFKAAIRVNKFTSIAQLRGASLHAQRYDETGKARVREGAEPGIHAINKAIPNRFTF